MIWAVLAAIGAIVGALLLNVLASEAYSWFPRIANWLIRFHVARLPAPLQERMREEWEALVIDTPGHLSKLLCALDLFRAIPSLRHAHSYPGVPHRPLFDTTWRVVDVLVAGIGLVFALPLSLIIAAAIKVTSRGPVFVRTPMLGRHRREFGLYGFRTLTRRQQGTSFTPIGFWISKFDLDGIPQLLNIVAGHMSLVGPTPVHRDWVAKGSFLPPVPAAVFCVRPGLTSRARVTLRPPRIDTLGSLGRWWREEHSINVQYVMRRGFCENLRVMWATIRLTFTRPDDICRF